MEVGSQTSMTMSESGVGRLCAITRQNSGAASNAFARRVPGLKFGGVNEPAETSSADSTVMFFAEIFVTFEQALGALAWAAEITGARRIARITIRMMCAAE